MVGWLGGCVVLSLGGWLAMWLVCYVAGFGCCGFLAVWPDWLSDWLVEAWGWLLMWLGGYVIIKSYGWPGYLRHRWLYRSLSGWLQVCMPSGLARWLAGSAAGWLCYTAGWLIWLVGYMSGWLAVGLCDCVTGRLCGPLALQLGGCLVLRLRSDEAE